MIFQALVYDGFDELDLIGVFEPLQMMNLHVSLRSLYEQPIVTGAYGLRIQVEAVFDPAQRPDVLLVPGGGWLTRSPQGAWTEANKGTILDCLRECRHAGSILASVCTGSLLIAKAGLLKDTPATTNHAAIDELISLGATYIAARVVDTGDIVTAAGVTSSIDLGLWLTERFLGHEAALDLARRLEFDRRGPAWQQLPESGYPLNIE